MVGAPMRVEAAVTTKSCRTAVSRQPGGAEPAAVVVDVGVGDDDGVPGSVWVGRVLGVSVGLMVSDGELDGDGDVGPLDGATVGEALSALPTCAGGGKDSTACPASVVVIICCQANAASEPNIGDPWLVTGLFRSALPNQTAVDSCGVKPMNQASKLSLP